MSIEDIAETIKKADDMEIPSAMVEYVRAIAHMMLEDRKAKTFEIGEFNVYSQSESKPDENLESANRRIQALLDENTAIAHQNSQLKDMIRSLGVSLDAYDRITKNARALIGPRK